MKLKRYYVGINFDIKFAHTVLVEENVSVRRFTLLAKETKTFDQGVGWTNTFKEIYSYFSLLPAEIRKHIPRKKQEILYVVRVANSVTDLNSIGFNRNIAPSDLRSVMFYYHQLLGVIKMALLQRRVNVSYYPTVFMNLFFYGEKTTSKLALKVAIKNQWRREMPTYGYTYALGLCYIEKLKIFLQGGKSFWTHLYTKKQRHLLRVLLKLGTVPRKYDILFDEVLDAIGEEESHKSGELYETQDQPTEVEQPSEEV